MLVHQGDHIFVADADNMKDQIRKSFHEPKRGSISGKKWQYLRDPASGKSSVCEELASMALRNLPAVSPPACFK
jgi:hypothetical protein